jgi:hypothetical protein
MNRRIVAFVIAFLVGGCRSSSSTLDAPNGGAAPETDEPVSAGSAAPGHTVSRGSCIYEFRTVLSCDTGGPDDEPFERKCMPGPCKDLDLSDDVLLAGGECSGWSEHRNEHDVKWSCDDDAKHAASDTGSIPPPAPPPAPACPATTIDTSQISYRPPNPRKPGSCSQADLDALDAAAASPSMTEASLHAAVSASCGACVFGDAASATWPPIPERGGEAVTVNIGGCYETMLGHHACAGALQNLDDCRFLACAECADPPSFAACFAVVDKGLCRPYAYAIASACTGVTQAELDGAADSCEADGSKYTFDSPVRVACM